MRASWIVACSASGLLVLLAACAGSAPRTASAGQSGSAGHGGYAQLTTSEAYSAFTQFLPQFAALSAHPTDIGRLTTGPEFQVVTTSHGPPGPAVGELTDTRILVPKLTSYPRWFIAGGTNSSTGQGFLFVLVQRAAQGPWQETAELYDLGPQPRLMPDLAAAGFSPAAMAETVASPGASLAMQPAQLAAAYAQYLNDKGKGAQHGKFKAGSYTTGLISLEHTASAGAQPRGWKYTDTQAAAGLPQYTLRLPAGQGAAVIFFTVDRVTWTAQSSARIPTATYTGLSEPPLRMLQALGIKAVRPGLRVSVKAVDENLAFIGPPGTSGVTIAANVGRTDGLSKS